MPTPQHRKEQRVCVPGVPTALCSNWFGGGGGGMRGEGEGEGGGMDQPSWFGEGRERWYTEPHQLLAGGGRDVG